MTQVSKLLSDLVAAAAVVGPIRPVVEIVQDQELKAVALRLAWNIFYDPTFANPEYLATIKKNPELDANSKFQALHISGTLLPLFIEYTRNAQRFGSERSFQSHLEELLHVFSAMTSIWFTKLSQGRWDEYGKPNYASQRPTFVLTYSLVLTNGPTGFDIEEAYDRELLKFKEPQEAICGGYMGMLYPSIEEPGNYDLMDNTEFTRIMEENGGEMSYLESLKQPVAKVPVVFARIGNLIKAHMCVSLTASSEDPTECNHDSSKPKPDGWIPRLSDEDLIGLSSNTFNRLTATVNTIIPPNSGVVFSGFSELLDESDELNIKAFRSVILKKAYNHLLKGLDPDTFVRGVIVHIMEVRFKDETAAKAVDLSGQTLDLHYEDMMDNTPFAFRMKYTVYLINPRLGMVEELVATPEMIQIFEDEIARIKKEK